MNPGEGAELWLGFDRAEGLARNASAAAAQVIRLAIVEGRVRPGQRLKESELARELGISRTPVREALLILQTEGLLTAVPNRGCVVRSYDIEALEDMYRLRAHLEGFGAKLAAPRITAKTIRAMEESCDRFERLSWEDDALELLKENLKFHRLVLESAKSERLLQMIAAATDLPLVYRSFYYFSAEQKRLSVHHHRQLTRALEAREGDRAAHILEEHILEARDFLIARLRENPASLEPD